MTTTRKRFNPKRRLCEAVPPLSDREAIASRLNYEGSPYHKRNPGDFGLDPPSLPRRDKTLCDGVHIFKRLEALELLRQGVLRGTFDARFDGDYPVNVWAITRSGHVVEANGSSGVYHGYPLLDDDPIVEQVKERWNNEHGAEA